MTGARIVQASVVGTTVFALVAAAATAAPDALDVVAVPVDLVLFAAGCVAFLRGLLLAARRSRTEELSVGGLWFLSGSAPPAVRRRLLGALGVQVVVALVTASIRPFTGLAFGILVPVYGLGLAGLWAAAHGSFPARSVTPVRRPRPGP